MLRGISVSLQGPVLAQAGFRAGFDDWGGVALVLMEAARCPAFRGNATERRLMGGEAGVNTHTYQVISERSTATKSGRATSCSEAVH